jgi:hypothetical protein
MYRTLAVLVISCLFPVSISTAQTPAASTKAGVTSNAPQQVKTITLSGSIRARAENWGWFVTANAENDYTFGAVLLRLSVAGASDRIDWQVEGAFPLLLNLPTGAVAPAPQGQLGLGGSYFAANGRKDGSANLKQAYLRIKHIGDRGSLRVGRFEFADGAETAPADPTLAVLKRDHIAHRLIGPFSFTHVGRSFDGAHFVHQTKNGNFTLLGARPTEGVFQLRGLRQLDVDFYYGAYTGSRATKRVQSEWRVLALHYHDGRRVLKTDNRPQAVRQADLENIRTTTAGGHYIGAVKLGEGGNRGTADVLLWGVGQFGRWGALDHRAGAIAVEAGFQFNARWRPWLRAGYFRGSGDGNPGDNRHGTFFQMLPTPRIYARTPFYNLMNNEDIFVQVRARPHSRLQVRADLREVRLSSANDLWYVGGGAFQQGTFGFIGRPSLGARRLGTFADVSLDFAATKTTAMTFYLGGIRGGDVQARIYPRGGNHPGAHFLYLEITQRF